MPETPIQTENGPVLRTAELNRHHRRITAWSLLASVVLHLLVILLFGKWDPRLTADAAAGRRTGDDRPAAASGGLLALQIRTEQTAIVRPPAPVVAPEFVVEVDEPPPTIEISALGQDGLAGIEVGPSDGAGSGDTGAGTGDGGDADDGRLVVLPPSPRSLMTAPMGRPSGLRGREIQVAVFVDETGRVVADSTRLIPPSGNASYDEELRRRAAQWSFEPATRGGRAVAAWFEYTLTF